MSRTCERWASLPGSFDSHHTRLRFAADNPWGIPTLPHAPLSATPEWLVPYGQRVRAEGEVTGACHFFLDDYRFETVWSRPTQTLAAVQRCPVALTPDFSLYRDTPRAVQVYNVYRSRWCGAWWSLHGLTVVPTISWGTAETFDFCFLGVARHSLVAISTVGVKLDQPLERDLFVTGYREMVSRLTPSRVLCYGENLPEEVAALAEVRPYPPLWKGIRAARRAAEQHPSAEATSGLPREDTSETVGHARSLRWEGPDGG